MFLRNKTNKSGNLLAFTVCLQPFLWRSRCNGCGRTALSNIDRVYEKERWPTQHSINWRENRHQTRNTAEQVHTERYVLFFKSQYRLFHYDYMISESRSARSAAAPPSQTTNLNGHFSSYVYMFVLLTCFTRYFWTAPNIFDHFFKYLLFWTFTVFLRFHSWIFENFKTFRFTFNLSLPRANVEQYKVCRFLENDERKPSLLLPLTLPVPVPFLLFFAPVPSLAPTATKPKTPILVILPPSPRDASVPIIGPNPHHAVPPTRSCHHPPSRYASVPIFAVLPTTLWHRFPSLSCPSQSVSLLLPTCFCFRSVALLQVRGTLTHTKRVENVKLK